jgi:hypothetical protein
MAPKETIRAQLAVGRHRLSVGRVMEVLERVCSHPRQVNQLIECLWDQDPGVANRAADAVEKLFFARHDLHNLIDPWKAALLGLLVETDSIKLRWRLAVVVPRLRLSSSERQKVAEVLQSFLADRSSIVKTCAMEGLAALARHDESLAPLVLDLLRIHTRSGTPAMRARGRQLLKRLDAEPGKLLSDQLAICSGKTCEDEVPD